MISLRSVGLQLCDGRHRRRLSLGRRPKPILRSPGRMVKNHFGLHERSLPPQQPNQFEAFKLIFVQAGYREGITAGKESTVQAGFDAGYAQVGVPLGRQIGLLRGTALALMTFIDSPQPSQPTETFTEALREIRAISAQLSDIRFSDIVPRDLEAEAHAREHLADGESDLPVIELDENGLVQDGEAIERRKMEQLEDMMSSVGTNSAPASSFSRPGSEDVKALHTRLLHVGRIVGLELD